MGTRKARPQKAGGLFGFLDKKTNPQPANPPQSATNPPESAANPPETKDVFINTTNQPFCFGIPREYPNAAAAKETAAKVGPQTFKKYEHLMFVLAQYSRVAYCDTGIMYLMLRDYVGLDPSIVSSQISRFDKMFTKERRESQKSQAYNGLLVDGATTSIARGSAKFTKGLVTTAVKAPLKTAALASGISTGVITSALTGRMSSNPMLNYAIGLNPNNKKEQLERNRERALGQRGGAARLVQEGETQGLLQYLLPMESYTLGPEPPANAPKVGFYLSAPNNLTLFGVKVGFSQEVIKNPNSVMKENDVVLCFKGTGTLAELLHDAKSQTSATEFSTILEADQSLSNIWKNKTYGRVNTVFFKSVVSSFSTIINELESITTKNKPSNIFITGHSLGGAYATAFAWILALLKKEKDPRAMMFDKINLMSFGAPTLASDAARVNLNDVLDKGFLNYDRVVSQGVATVTALGSAINDIIPKIPIGFTHLGYNVLATELTTPDTRPFAYDGIRRLFGIQTKNRGRLAETNPFVGSVEESPPPQEEQEALNNPDLQNIENQIVAAAPPNIPQSANPPEQIGGFLGLGAKKGEYSAITKNRSPNFISFQGSKYMSAFAHGEYLRIFFLGGFRQPGMKNPTQGNFGALFSFHAVSKGTGVKIGYVDWNPYTIMSISAVSPAPPAPSAPPSEVKTLPAAIANKSAAPPAIPIGGGKAPYAYEATMKSLFSWAESELAHVGRIAAVKNPQIQYSYALSTVNGMAHLKDALFELVKEMKSKDKKRDILRVHDQVIRVMKHLIREYKIDLTPIKKFNVKGVLSNLGYLRNTRRAAKVRGRTRKH